MKKYKNWSLEIVEFIFIYFFKSPRGGAKSYSMMDYSIGDFIENFNEFFWLRRKQSEIDNETAKLIPDGIMEKYGIQGFVCKKGSVMITFDGKNYVRCGWYGAISTFKKGQRNFRNVKTIVFDEYNDTVELLTNERFKFWNAIATIVDTRNDYRIFFLGNESIFYSPYEYLETREGVKVVEIKEIDKGYLGTPLYNAVSNTDVGNYMFESNYFKNFKWLFEPDKLQKANKKLIVKYNSIDFWYLNDRDIIVVDYVESSKNNINREEFSNIEKRLLDYYNRDRFYYTSKETFKKVSEVLPEFIK